MEFEFIIFKFEKGDEKFEINQINYVFIRKESCTYRYSIMKLQSYRCLWEILIEEFFFGVQLH